MKNITIGICSESEEITKLLIQHFKIAKAVFDVTFEVFTYATGESLLSHYSPIFDILFVDIPLSDMDSETILSNVRQRDSYVQIIMIAPNNESYPLAFRYNVRNYFVTPLRYFHVYHELKKFLEEEPVNRKPHIWISNQHGYYKIYVQLLRYIETSNRQLCFQYGSRKLYFHGKMSSLEQQLPPEQFFRCNNSYIVNVDYIEKIEKDLNRYRITLITGEVLPLSRDLKKELVKRLGITE